MDKWLEEFQKKNGRKPTFAEFQAHAAEQKSAATGDAPVQQSVEANQPNDSAVSQQTQTGQSSAPTQPEKLAQTDQSTQPQQIVTPGQTDQPSQQTQTNQTADVNSSAQAVRSTPNIANTQPTQNGINSQAVQNGVNAQAAQNAANTQDHATNATVNMPANNAEGPQQQQVTPQNPGMAQQNFAQPSVPQPSAPKKPSKSGSKVKRFFFSPLSITAMAVVILLIGFVTTGFLTSTSRNSLRNKYNEAIKNNDPKALLALFPKDQTESRFADVGAKQLIKSKKSFEDIEKASSNDDFSLTNRKHLLFFTNYSLNASTTMIGTGDAPKDGKLTIDNRKMNDDDFKIGFFPGTYKIKSEVDNEFGKSKFTTEVKAGKNKVVSLNFDIADRYVTLPAGPDSLYVSYKDKKTDIKLSEKEQKIGPFAKDKYERRGPSSKLTVSGEYGGISIKDAPLELINSSSTNFELEGQKMSPVYSSYVTLDKKKLDSYVKVVASEWFEAGHKGSKKGLSSLDELISGTKLPTRFKDNNVFKYAYKGFKLNDRFPYDVYIGGGKLYVVATFELQYTQTDIKEKDAKPKDKEAITAIIFRIDKDGKMTAVGDYFSARFDH